MGRMKNCGSKIKITRRKKFRKIKRNTIDLLNTFKVLINDWFQVLLGPII